MPDMSNIDMEKILSAAGQLDGVVDRMSGCVDKFTAAVENLDKGWISEVKTGFMATYQNDWEAMQEMLGQLREINDTLRGAASDFDKTENETLSGVNALR